VSKPGQTNPAVRKRERLVSFFRKALKEGLKDRLDLNGMKIFMKLAGQFATERLKILVTNTDLTKSGSTYTVVVTDEFGEFTIEEEVKTMASKVAAKAKAKDKEGSKKDKAQDKKAMKGKAGKGGKGGFFGGKDKN